MLFPPHQHIYPFSGAPVAWGLVSLSAYGGSQLGGLVPCRLFFSDYFAWALILLFFSSLIFFRLYPLLIWDSRSWEVILPDESRLAHSRTAIPLSDPQSLDWVWWVGVCFRGETDRSLKIRTIQKHTLLLEKEKLVTWHLGLLLPEDPLMVAFLSVHTRKTEVWAKSPQKLHISICWPC